MTRHFHPHQDDGRTKQSEQEGSNINTIMERYLQTGVVPGNRSTPTYGDFTAADDYHSALNRINAAEADFMALPSKVRDHVDNDPQKFLEMVYDPDRRGELEELGLVEAQAPKDAPEKTPVVKDPQKPVDEPLKKE